MKTTRHLMAPVLLAGLLAAAGAHAQNSSASATSDVPAKAGEASTMTQGVPNAKTTNATNTGAGFGPAAADVRTGSTASTTSSVPPSAGEASTMVNGRPNAQPNDPRLNKTRDQRRAEKELKKADARTQRELAVMGQRGATAGAPAGTPAVSPAGNPPVQAGGTPK